LLALLYIAYSIVPVVTFVLAVVDMDLEKAKYSSLRPVAGGYRPLATPVVAPRAAAVPNRSLPQPQGQPKASMNGNAVQAPTSSGWKFPFRKSSESGATQNGTPGPVPLLVE
jgi:hypothetical protein